MSLYIPAHFASSGNAAATRLMHDHPFATIITPTDGEPAVSHLPLLLDAADGPLGTLSGHFARANPHWRIAAMRPSVIVFHGPHAYISPSWYAAPAKSVPTWNYAAVHVHGTLAFSDDTLGARAVLERLAARFEQGRVAPWTMTLPPRERDAMVGAIVAFTVPIMRIDAKLKLSQNRSLADRTGVIAGLTGDPHADSAATAQWMREYGTP